VWLRETLAWDVSLMRSIHRLSTPWLDTVMKGITWTASTAAVALAVGIILRLWRRHRLKALMLSLAFIGSVIMSNLLKLLFARPRPDVFPPLSIEHSYSFPSGHTSTAVAFYGLLAVLLWRAHHRGWALLSGAWVGAVAFSRIYLGVHYPSDVLGSLALGLLWIFAVILVHDWFQRKATRELPLE
jgi:undecaprenyl-diphosphatase